MNAYFFVFVLLCEGLISIQEKRMSKFYQTEKHVLSPYRRKKSVCCSALSAQAHIVDTCQRQNRKNMTLVFTNIYMEDGIDRDNVTHGCYRFKFKAHLTQIL